jgi:hypothetical protein
MSGSSQQAQRLCPQLRALATTTRRRPGELPQQKLSTSEDRGLKDDPKQSRQGCERKKARKSDLRAMRPLQPQQPSRPPLAQSSTLAYRAEFSRMFTSELIRVVMLKRKNFRSQQIFFYGLEDWQDILSARDFFAARPRLLTGKSNPQPRFPGCMVASKI